MRSFILFVVFISVSTLALSQNNEGTIIYEDKINVWKNLPPEMESMKSNIPEYRSQSATMLFTSEESFYAPKKKTEAEKAASRERRAGEKRGERRRRRGMRGGKRNKEKIYRNLADNNSKSSSQFFGKQFLVSGPLKKYDWKLSGKQKQVGSFLCQEAIYKDSTDIIHAWFTPMIPVNSGPSTYGGLPGMILHMDFNDGSRTITATDVQLGKIDRSLIVEPTEGKKISHEEFEILKEEKMKEMKEEYGGEGRRVFMRRG